MYYKTRPYRLFSVLNSFILLFIAVLCMLPLWHTLAVSLSGRAPANANLVMLLPIDLTLDAYRKTLANPDFLQSLGIAFQRTIVGTLFGMIVIFLAAYPLSKTKSAFSSRSFYSWFFIIILLFNGGLVPTYIVVQKLGLMNSLWALILPSTVNVWLLILMMSFFRGVPRELEEAALIDGAGQFRILLTIFLPISMPAVATLSLFTMVFHWNSWFDGLIYMTRAERYPLSTFLQTILVQIDTSQLGTASRDLENISNKTVKAAQIFIGALPILAVYPFLQKYFVKGMVLGAIKE
ncbi:carbohydrate ABC transporter permease [Paenibacillus sp. J5C_2022]|uniref:carbohydrate ABC transporter permease n=1 Tax=Paenibacillus sp. J5C2022 TaxID=2977129 RepID=UPI0021D07D41|nr:carbohydrate ABC transporter permease [Paenibacillus sp. J5C2022]MCU6710231.1 carbohydrate ABC transporter permease [Paenibacillus sp. J5C2022]